MFTDIEGSTKLWEAVGNSFKPLLDLHSALIRECLFSHQGYECKTEGDAFMAEERGGHHQQRRAQPQRLMVQRGKPSSCWAHAGASSREAAASL